MISCGVMTGILFSRKPCANPAALRCGRCRQPLCKQHLVPQVQGPFLCPNCDAYEQDEDWRYHERSRRWRHRSAWDDDERRPPVVAGAPAPVLKPEDKAGFAAAQDAADDAALEDAMEGSDFDAS